MPIFILTTSDLVIGGDEELPHDNGPAHPMSFPAPQWMLPQGANSKSSIVVMVDNENISREVVG